jgi:ABC-type transporter Mla subunit MlaD
MAVGIFVVVAVSALVGLIFKFGDLPVFVSKYKSFDVCVQFPTAPGVEENTPVRFCGYQIGRVTEVKPPAVMKEVNSNRFYHQTMVILSIDKKYRDNIPEDVEVKLMTRGLGSSYIELKLRHFDVNEPTGKFLTSGSLLQGSTGMTSEFFPEESQKKLDELADSLGTLVRNANDILGDQANKENLKSTLANLSEATARATEVMKEFRDFSAAGARTVEELSKTGAELRLILEKVNSGEGTAAKLVNDGRLYENLLENTQQVQVLLEELKSFIAESREKGLPIKVK